MIRLIFAGLSGALFGLGLLVSGMTDTTKVMGWLDVTGSWDPTLAFVLGGAIIPMALAWRVAKRRVAPIAGGAFPQLPSSQITTGLIAGSGLFGAGWGLAGLCPGPALASLSFGGWNGALFFAAMAVGMWGAVPLRRTASSDPGPA